MATKTFNTHKLNDEHFDVDTNGNIISKGKVKVSSDDTTADYLENKLEYGYFDTNKHIPKGFMINNDYSGVKKRALNPILEANYIVETEAELDYALDDIGTSGVGGSVFFLKGTYDKGSHYYIPAVDNIELKGHSAKFIRPTSDDLFVCQDGTSFKGLVIDGLNFYGEDNNDYVFLKLPNNSSYLQYSSIQNCHFYDNGYDYITGCNYQLVISNNNIYIGHHYRDSNITGINLNGGNVQQCVIENNLFYVGGPQGSCQPIRLNGSNGNSQNQILNNKINWIDINIYDNACIYCKKHDNSSIDYFNIIKDNTIFLHENRSTDYIIKSDVNSGRIQISDNTVIPVSAPNVSFINISDNGGSQRVFHNTILI